jgi:hypothetical protein
LLHFTFPSFSGHRCYREYPVEWIERKLVEDNFKIIDVRKFPILYSHASITRQLNVARSKLPLFPSKDLATEMGRTIDALEAEAKAVCESCEGGRIKFGFDYVVSAEKQK